MTGQAVLGGTVALAPLTGVVNPIGRYSILAAGAVTARSTA